MIMVTIGIPEMSSGFSATCLASSLADEIMGIGSEMDDWGEPAYVWFAANPTKKGEKLADSIMVVIGMGAYNLPRGGHDLGEKIATTVFNHLNRFLPDKDKKRVSWCLQRFTETTSKGVVETT